MLPIISPRTGNETCLFRYFYSCLLRFAMIYIHILVLKTIETNTQSKILIRKHLLFDYKDIFIQITMTLTNAHGINTMLFYILKIKTMLTRERRFCRSKANSYAKKVTHLNKYLTNFVPEIHPRIVFDPLGNVALLDFELTELRRLDLSTLNVEMSFLEYRASLLNLELEHFATPEVERIAKSETSRKEKHFIEAVTFEQASFGNSVI